MLAKAIARYVRMTPRKVNYLVTPLRRRTVAEAMIALANAKRRAAIPVQKLLKSAFANARQHDATLREEDVIISNAYANAGPTWKRFRAAAFGRAAPILKRTSHITIELDKRRSNGSKG